MNSEQKNFLKKLGLSNNSIEYFGQGFKTILENETSNKNILSEIWRDYNKYECFWYGTFYTIYWV